MSINYVDIFLFFRHVFCYGANWVSGRSYAQKFDQNKRQIREI
jgi:hypothetical protein